MTEQTIALPQINTQIILAQPIVQEIIATESNKSTENGIQLKAFLEDGLQKLFNDQNKTVEQVDKVFQEVVEIDKIKQSIKDTINTYQTVDNTSVDTALKTIDNDLNEIKPLVAALKDSIEGTTNFFKKLFSADTKNIFLSSLQGIAGRIDSIDSVFQKADINLKKNEEVLIRLLPEIGFRISKLDSMIACLENILQTITDPNSSQIIKNLRDELINISGIQKESLSRLMMLSVTNGNSKLVLQASRVEVLTSLQPLIAENIIGANQKKVYELRNKVRAGIKNLRETSKNNINDIMQMEETEKTKFKDRLNEVTSNIDWILEKSKIHQENMNQAQKVIDAYLPEYQKKITNLENKIYDISSQSQNFNDASQLLINKMLAEKKELESKTAPTNK